MGTPRPPQGAGSWPHPRLTRRECAQWAVCVKIRQKSHLHRGTVAKQRLRSGRSNDRPFYTVQMKQCWNLGRNKPKHTMVLLTVWATPGLPGTVAWQERPTKPAVPARTRLSSLPGRGDLDLGKTKSCTSCLGPHRCCHGVS